MSVVEPSVRASQTQQPWSVRMADAMIARHNPAEAEWHYEHGLLLWAIDRAGEASGDPAIRTRYRAHVRATTDLFVQPDGSIRTYNLRDYNLDQINHGNVLFALYRDTGEEKYRKAIYLLRKQLALQPRNASGGFWHKQIYPYQMWLDSLYMASPFLTRFAAMFNEPALFDEVAHQILLLNDRARDPATGLIYHAWDESRCQPWSNPQTGNSPHFWGRAMGWMMMALVDILDVLPAKHTRRGDLLVVLDQLATAVARVQDGASGLWWQIVDQGGRAGNYLEASASCMFVYGMARGAAQGYLAPAFFDVAHTGFAGVLDNLVSTEDDGLLTLNQICAVAGLGGTPYRDGTYEYYVGERQKANDYKGVGPFILAALEMERAQSPARPAL